MLAEPCPAAEPTEPLAVVDVAVAGWLEERTAVSSSAGEFVLQLRCHLPTQLASALDKQMRQRQMHCWYTCCAVLKQVLATEDQ